ncbi:MAG: hypothetical protein R3E01_16250 [Pirellulaceae bacterium]
MWRAFFMSVGVTLCILGAECMFVDRLVMAEETPTASVEIGGYDYAPYTASATGRRVFVPPEWAPWGLMSAGVVTILYSITFSKVSRE